MGAGRVPTLLQSRNILAFPASADSLRLVHTGRMCCSRKGCDWTLGGLFAVHKLEVVTPNGNKCPRLEVVSSEDAAHMKSTEGLTADGPRALNSQQAVTWVSSRVPLLAPRSRAGLPGFVGSRGSFIVSVQPGFKVGLRVLTEQLVHGKNFKHPACGRAKYPSIRRIAAEGRFAPSTALMRHPLR